MPRKKEWGNSEPSPKGGGQGEGDARNGTAFSSLGGDVDALGKAWRVFVGRTVTKAQKTAVLNLNATIDVAQKMVFVRQKIIFC